jgi:immune inhibitor A
VLAHEFQHMIHWNLDRNEESWLNEGASELAAFLNGFDIGGFDQVYAANTDVQFNYWPDVDEEDTTPHYGVGFLFLDYYLNRFGAEATQTLVRAEANGLESIDQALAALGVTNDTSGQDLKSEDLFAEFAAALYLNDPAVSGGRYAFANYPEAPLPRLAEVISDCPTGVQDRDVAQFGIDYIQIRCSGEYRLRFAGASTVSALPVDPVSGDYAVWSNRGDESDMTLTRAFDLPSGGPVALNFKLWYDIEENWDYAYLEVSTDEGQTWTILQTPSGTDANPQGNNYGWGYSGVSGGRSQAEWVDEQVDLSPYSGQHVLIRFEYITDAALYKEGLLLDDIRLSAANYSTDFESDLGGWQAEGFVRLQNVLPQTYKVLLIREGRPTMVTPLVLDERMAGEAPVVIGPGERAVLVVIGSARFTLQRAPYQFEIVP